MNIVEWEHHCQERVMLTRLTKSCRMDTRRCRTAVMSIGDVQITGLRQRAVQRGYF